VGNGLSNEGDVFQGPTFSLSNRISKAIMAVISTVEMRTGTNWIVYSSPAILLTIDPNSRIYKTIPFPDPPNPPNTSRIHLVTLEPARLPAAFSAFRFYVSSWMHGRRALIPKNPFSKEMSWYGNSHELISDEVTDPGAIRRVTDF